MVARSMRIGGVGLLAAALAVAGLAWPADASAAGPSTTLTATQADAVLRAAIANTEQRALVVGTRQSSVSGSVERNDFWNQYRSTVRVDAARRSVAETTDAVGQIAIPAIYIADPCDPGTGGLGARRQSYVTTAGVGTWTKLQRTPNERTGLRLLKRSPVRWELAKRPKASVRSTYRQVGWGGDVRGNFLSMFKLTGGTSTLTATGRRVTAAFTEKQPYGTPSHGTLTLDVDVHGALVHYLTLEDVGGSEPHQTWRTYWSATYGGQVVKHPSQHRSIGTKALQRGCRAAMAKQAPQQLAVEAARIANDWAKSTGRRLTVKRLRAFVAERDWTAIYRLDVRKVSIKGGTQIVSRHALLKHPYVSTVFIRHGKAVAHRVR